MLPSIREAELRIAIRPSVRLSRASVCIR